MKKILYHTLSLLFASLLFVACAKEAVVTTFGEQEGATLTLHLSNDKLQSRAEAGNDTYNENAILKVDLYLYPSGSTGQALHKISRTFDNTTKEVTITEKLDNDLIEGLFGSNTVCKAYALVNYPGTAPAEKTDASFIANLKAMEIAADFTKTQTSFVMDGESDNISYNPTTKVVTGEVQVKRAASKIGFFVTGVDKTVEDDAGNVWMPNYEEMDISFHNGVNKAKVDVGYTSEGRPNNTQTSAEGSYYETSDNISIINSTDNTEANTYDLETTHVPFYSYSSDWGRATNPDIEPTITLMVPWRKIQDKDGNKITEVNWQTCYYQIPLNVKSIGGSLTDCMERNMYYKINFHVGILGDFNPATPTIIPASYYTVDWETEDVNVDIKNYKYLVVDKNDVTVYNENEVRIGYASSDAIKAEITYIRRPDYSDAEVDTIRYYQTLTSTTGTNLVSQGTNKLLRDCSIRIEDHEIVLFHNIVNKSNSSSTNYDYLPYYIKVKITMTVNVNGTEKIFTEWINYTQYPAIYIKAVPNQKGNIKNSKERGYVYVNGTSQTDYTQSSNSGKWQTVEGTDATSNNPNMYIITTTALDAASNYIIGDSRVSKINNIVSTGWTEAPALYGESPRTLTYYYPTRTDNENYISPQFRISSAYGQLGDNTLTMEQAQKRCAAYQEDGFPAGRWRLPTSAEFDYIGKLCAEEKIPPIFSSGLYYWSATRIYDYSQNNGGSITENTSRNTAFMRCVYDDWYWGSNRIDDRTKFTWGDAPRN